MAFESQSNIISLGAPSWCEILRRQFASSQEMLANVIRSCPESAWAATEPGIWQHAYHVLLSLAIWLHWPEPVIAFPAFHHEGAGELLPGAGPIYSKEAIEAYQREVGEIVDSWFAQVNDDLLREELTLRGTRFTRADLLLGQIRHTQHHVGCMHVILRQKAGSAPSWVGYGE